MRVQNLTQAKEQEFTLIPEGQYPALVISATEGESKEKKTPFIKVKYEILEGEFAGKNIYDNFFFSEASLWRLNNALAIMGVEITDDMDVTESTFNGRTCLITVKHKEYNGKVYANVGKYDPWDPGAPPEDEIEEPEFDGDVPF